MSMVSHALLGGRLDGAVLREAERSTLMVVDDPWRQYSSFTLRLLLATVIATCGIAADSAAAVIGAMLVAPLMSPMVGTALACAEGSPRAVLRTLLITAAGTAGVIAVSAAVAAVIPVGIDMGTNAQVLSRISPRLVDLVIAVAAGAVAALSLLRRDISDAVPGIALSASIVPPLCVVGAGLYKADLAAAAGALLLFCTNYVAVQVSCGIAFVLMGVPRHGAGAIEGRARGLWYGMVGFAAVAILLLLLGTSLGIVRDNERLRAVQGAVATWLEDSGYRVGSLGIEDDRLYLSIAGMGPVPETRALTDGLDEAGAELDGVSLAVVEEQRLDC